MRKQQGLSLVELMVAMAIGLVISLAVMQVFISNKNTFVMQGAASHLQENGRFALQYLAAELRPVGVGLGARLDEESICVVATGGAAAEWNAMNRPIWGQRITANGALGAVGTDQLSMFVNDGCESFLTAGELLKPGANANIKVTAYCPSMQQDRAVMVLDMEKAVIIRVSNKPNSSGSGQVTLTHAAGNNNKDAKCGGFKFSDIAFTSPARVVGFSHKTFYVADTDRAAVTGQPIRALFVRDVAQIPAQSTEIVEGVESMRTHYGVAAAGSVGVQTYLSATEVEAANRWGDVRTVKIDLLLVTAERAPGAQDQAIQFDGAAVAADGRLRQVFSTVVALRNRID
ncbi:prepilin-type N-terminal cleavage/methylation domain-containing protein [Pseudomonas cavernicola]|uniref:Prepilin-type N-terminal cleavage/methylation domain-containing protein n=1 Tax=Pseudomonas cavernicola TaxID=2320866 RepID=A0A418XHP0_9PSED|nr:PilW family protein [Pseudomonas cavernicola]RJG11978.1 prepilin-type N-terminal cleavage/methylation domain-containing protein [Pseudomonas cavernicola]